MKRIIYYALLMMIVVLILPLVIVRGCSFTAEEQKRPQTGQTGTKIKVFISQENRLEEMDLEEYLMEVVAAEMPAEFEAEALKAQAVAARTYAYRKIKSRQAAPQTQEGNPHPGADVCTDSTHCQAWIKQSDVMKKWEASSAQNNWKKIENAVLETEGVIITYNNTLANPVFHAISGGKTENSEDVWEGAGEPYLRSVASPGEETSTGFEVAVTLKTKDLQDAMKKRYPDIKFTQKDILKDIKIVEKTEGDRVKTLKVGNVTLKGTEFRDLFSLRSANFKIEKGDGDTLKITCVGYGHGVGMSQWGANYLARNGETYEQILKHYYTGIELNTLDAYEVGMR